MSAQAQAFYEKVGEEVLQEFDLGHVMETKRMNKENEENEEKKRLLISLAERMEKVKIKVQSLSQGDLAKVDKNNLMSEMESAMMTHSKIIDDIFQMKTALEDMKSIRNNLTQMIHHKLKFRNQLNLKTAKEIQTYMDADVIFNQVIVQIKKVEAQIEKSQEFSSLLRSKIGFIRDLTKLKTQELFGEQSG